MGSIPKIVELQRQSDIGLAQERERRARSHFLVDVFEHGILGSEAERLLERCGLTVNKNGIPFDPNPPLKPSGIRIGTPAITTRGLGDEEMDHIAGWIDMGLRHGADEAAIARIRQEVFHLTDQYPIPE